MLPVAGEDPDNISSSSTDDETDDEKEKSENKDGTVDIPNTVFIYTKKKMMQKSYMLTLCF